MKKIVYALLALTMFAMFAMVGCADRSTTNNNSSSVTTPNSNAFTPKGTVTGVLTDSVTLVPIANADVYILDRHAVTSTDGSFIITDVPANTPVGTETGTSASDVYNVVIDLKNVNAAISSTSAKYPAIAYTTASVKYTSLGETSGAGGTGTNHDTPVNGFVANIRPAVGKLDGYLVIQVVKTSDLTAVSGATVELLSQGATNLANTSTGATGHLVASATTNASGIASFGPIEAATTFTARATSSDGKFQQTKTVVTEGDNITVSYLVQGNSTGTATTIRDAIRLVPVDTIAPFVTGTSIANLADIAPGTTSVVFTFSEPIQATSYATATTAAKSANGGLYADVAVNYTGAKASNMPYTLTWSSDRTQLTVAFTTNAASRYSVDISAAVLKLKDDANVAGINNAAFDTVTFSTNGGLTTAAAAISRDTTTSKIDWLPVTNALSYNIYVERVLAGTGSGYVLAGNSTVSTFTVSGSPLFAAGGKFDDLGYVYNSGEVVVKYNVKVVALNTEKTEGPASNIVSLEDIVAPTISARSFAGTFLTTAGSSTLAVLDATNLNGASKAFDYTFTVTFSEVMSKADVQTAANWNVSQGTTTNGGAFVAGAADVLPVIKSITYNPATNVATVTITYTNDATNTATTDPAHTVFTFSGKDLNGNAIKSTGNAIDGANAASF